MAKQLALFGGSLNPPAKYHVEIVSGLTPYFDEVIVLPCGSARARVDKPSLETISAEHRAEIVKLAFEGLPKVRIDLSDIKKHEYTRSWDLQTRFEKLGEVWHVVGSDLVVGGKDGASQIHGWISGNRLWHECGFAVVRRGGYAFDEQDLPPHHRVFDFGFSGSSTEIREYIATGQPFEHLMVPEVAEYIKEHGLYGWKGGVS